MSSLKRLNQSIKLKRLEGKDNIRQVDLSLRIFLSDVNQHTKKHPLAVTFAGAFIGLILSKYRRKIKTFYPLASLSYNYIKKNNQ